VLAADGWTLWEGLIFLCFVAFAPWLGLSAVAGILVRLLARDPAALVLPGLRALPPGPPRLRVLVAVCVRLEDMAEVLPMDFLDRHAGRFDAMLLLDADSRMSATTARRPSATRLT
jgi:hypothetical protein